jgi:hypothetical protein
MTGGPPLVKTLRISFLAVTLVSALLAGPIPTPFGTIEGVVLTGTGNGQFSQSSPQPGEIQFNFTLNNGEIISGEVCSFGPVTCVANGTGAVFNPAAPVLYASFSVGCGRANCEPAAYDLSADYQFAGNAVASDSASGSFFSNDIAGMNPSDSVGFHGAIGGATIVPSGGFTINPTGVVGSFPFSRSDGPDTFLNGGGPITANFNGSFTIAGPEDTLIVSGDVSLSAAPVPEPIGIGLALVGICGLIALGRRNSAPRGPMGLSSR